MGGEAHLVEYDPTRRLIYRMMLDADIIEVVVDKDGRARLRIKPEVLGLDEKSDEQPEK